MSSYGVDTFPDGAEYPVRLDELSLLSYIEIITVESAMLPSGDLKWCLVNRNYPELIGDEVIISSCINTNAVFFTGGCEIKDYSWVSETGSLYFKYQIIGSGYFTVYKKGKQ